MPLATRRDSGSSVQSHRPLVIGVGGIPMQCQFGDVWDVPVVMLHRTYLDAIGRGGAISVILSPTNVLAENADTALDLIDGLILAGGTDVDPALYGQQPQPKLGQVDSARDHCELALATAALARNLPILGICRGMELLNVSAGGTLIQHLPDTLGHDTHLRSVGTFERHVIDVAEDTITARLVGNPSRTVMSHHHQAIDKLGSDVTATAWDADRQVVEAIELTCSRLVVGVQWHPEEDPQSNLIERFIAEIASQQHDWSDR
jgi:putative glutamine amidotransferase